MLKNKKYAIIYKEKVSSTNDFLKDMLRVKNDREEVILLASEQTKGRGQFDRKWLSDYKKGLYLSYLFYPQLEYLSYINKEVALILVHILKSYNIESRIKLPNDIYVADKKIAGILTESVIIGGELKGVVVGIGLNLFFERGDFEKEKIQGTSMVLETNKKISKKSVAEALIEKLLKLNNKNMQDVEREFDKYKL